MYTLSIVLFSSIHSYKPCTFILFYRSVGLRDDLTFLLEEDLSHINLCSLHCEMRNCEQLLGSVGLFSYRIGSLDELNAALADYGPENCRGFPRVTVKLKPGQQTEVERYNIKVASFSGKCYILYICCSSIYFKLVQVCQKIAYV